MNYKILQILVILISINSSLNLFGQGIVTRPTQQLQMSKPKKTAQEVLVSEPDGYINGHGYVDLGLPSGLKWAISNLGASKLQEHGNYYVAWGEISTKSDYQASNSITLGKSISELKSHGVIDMTGNHLSMLHDAAQANWHNTWRMPTKENFEELINCCKWIWIEQNGFRGFKIIGPNGKSIFLPSSGYRGGYYFDHKDGIYWSSTPDSNDDNNISSYCLYFDNSNKMVGTSKRSGGRSVRAVSE